LAQPDGNPTFVKLSGIRVWNILEESEKFEKFLKNFEKKFFEKK
jgi:hypothetical protein